MLTLEDLLFSQSRAFKKSQKLLINAKLKSMKKAETLEILMCFEKGKTAMK